MSDKLNLFSFAGTSLYITPQPLRWDEPIETIPTGDFPDIVKCRMEQGPDEKGNYLVLVPFGRSKTGIPANCAGTYWVYGSNGIPHDEHPGSKPEMPHLRNVAQPCDGETGK